MLWEPFPAADTIDPLHLQPTRNVREQAVQSEQMIDFGSNGEGMKLNRRWI